MNIKNILISVSLLAVVACGQNDNANPLRGTNFVSDERGVNIVLTFANDEMRVNGRVVNLYNGTYELNGDKISFGPIASTMMMGPLNEMEIEQDYFKFLETVQTYTLTDEGKLTLENADGRTIVFQQVDAESEPVIKEITVVDEM
ncbi:MAG: META domain-containing protein [Alphaproteobacteria bacterium]|nr:META domain-containing protein [Alphaproteobacteria bacterium]